MRERGFAVGTAIMDKGYDNGPIHDGCMQRGVLPVTPLRKTLAVVRDDHKPRVCDHGEWTFAGTDKSGMQRSGAARPASASRSPDLTILAKLATALNRGRASSVAAG